MGIAKTTGAPVELRLGEKVYRFTPLKDKDFGEFEAWMQQKIITTASANLDLVPEELRAGLLRDVFIKASSVSMASSEAMEAISTLEGGCKLMLLSLRAEHPDIKEEEIRSLMRDKKFVNQMMATFDYLNGLTDLETEATVPKLPRRKTRRKKKKGVRSKRNT